MKVDTIKTLCISIILILPMVMSAQTKKSLQANLVEEHISIDGKLSEGSWQSSDIAAGFIQFEPYNGKPASQNTEVAVLYNDQGIYIGARLFDSSPDSILTQYGSRDDDNLNADYFSITLSPYQDGLNKWVFTVYSNGVQYDAKGNNNYNDENWNAAWQSSTIINDKGWIAEIFIPYSMIRFPKKEVQDWDINFWRSVRRHRELSTWNFVDNNIEGDITQSGVLTGLKDINPPLRLSLSPYVSGYVEKQPGSSVNTFFNYGADLKYGINESFTLDMTLIPDFGQVESDEEIYNLTPFEVQYDEKRQFFTEGTELFDKYDVFYTRRIGGTPKFQNRAYKDLQDGEEVISNPSAAPIVNATKLSGRTATGTGIGVFNAMTAMTEAVIRDSSDNTRTVVTQPFTNYNMVVADQNIFKNSRVGIFNTNVHRGKNETIANLTGIDWEFKDASNSFSLIGNIKISNKINPSSDNISGYSYFLETSKRSGTFRYEVSTWSRNETYDPNDMGYIVNNNENGYFAALYHHVLQPKGIILSSQMKLASIYILRQSDKNFQDFIMEAMYHAVFRNHLSAGINIDVNPFGQDDYYEPRTEGYHIHNTFGYDVGFWLSPDYRKKFVVDTRLSFSHMPKRNNIRYKISLGPRYRISDKLFITFNALAQKEFNEYGFVTNADREDVIFGSRDLTTYENQVSGKYIFNANSGITMKVRHYAITGLYDSFHNLSRNGHLSTSEYSGSHDFTFNAFTIDLGYSWYFAPASSLSLVWKNAVYTNGNGDTTSYFDNLKNTMDAEATNSVSLKILYYIDYVKVRSLFTK